MKKTWVKTLTKGLASASAAALLLQAALSGFAFEGESLVPGLSGGDIAAAVQESKKPGAENSLVPGTPLELDGVNLGSFSEELVPGWSDQPEKGEEPPNDLTIGESGASANQTGQAPFHYLDDVLLLSQGNELQDGSVLTGTEQLTIQYHYEVRPDKGGDVIRPGREYLVTVPEVFELLPGQPVIVKEEQPGVPAAQGNSVPPQTISLVFPENISSGSRNNGMRGTVEAQVRLNPDKLGSSENFKIEFPLGAGQSKTVTYRLAGRMTLADAAPKKVPAGFLQQVQLMTVDGVALNEGRLPDGSKVSVQTTMLAAYSYQIPSYDTPEGRQIVAGQGYTFPIPEELEFQIPGSFEIKGDQSTGDRDLMIAVLKVTGQEAAITFNQAAEEKGYLATNRLGYFYIGAGFNEDKIDNSGKQDIVFEDGNGAVFTNPVCFEIKPIEVSVKLDKKSIGIDFPNGQIQWEIEVAAQLTNAAKDHEATVKLTDLAVTDVLSQIPKHSYVAGSCQVTGPTGELAGVTIREEPEGTLKIAFPPVGSKAEETYRIVYSTRFTTDVLKGAKVTFQNNAGVTYQYPQYDTAADTVAFHTPTRVGEQRLQRNYSFAEDLKGEEPLKNWQVCTNSWLCFHM